MDNINIYPKLTNSDPKVNYSYPTVTHNDPKVKVNYSDPTVTHSNPTHFPLFSPTSPGLSLAISYVKFSLVTFQ